MQDREQWLNTAAELIRSEIFDNSDVPSFHYPYRIACGFPKGGRKTIGMCFPRSASADAVNEMYITPEKDAPVEVLSILVHEMLHALDNCEHGHKGPFATWARRIGLEGKLTATTPSDALRQRLADIAEACGEYPHQRLTVSKKDGIRQLKCLCRHCGAIWRMSQKWIESVNRCPCCSAGRSEISVDC